MTRRLMIATAIAAAATPAMAQDAERRVTVTFDATHPAQRFDDTVSDFESVAYVVTLQQGARLQVMLATNNASNCFDLYAPGASKPFYLGGESGNSHLLLAKDAGHYVIRVYLLRLAARDGQSAHYTLELTPQD